jgi:hypothetical protein
MVARYAEPVQLCTDLMSVDLLWHCQMVTLCLLWQYLKGVEKPVQLPVLAPHLSLVHVQHLAPLLSEADGHEELDNRGELVQVEVEPVCQSGQSPTIIVNHSLRQSGH